MESWTFRRRRIGLSLRASDLDAIAADWVDKLTPKQNRPAPWKPAGAGTLDLEGVGRVGSIPESNDDDDWLAELLRHAAEDTEAVEARFREALGPRAYKKRLEDLRRFEEGYPVSPIVAWMRKYGVSCLSIKSGGRYVAEGDVSQLPSGQSGRPPDEKDALRADFLARLPAAIGKARRSDPDGNLRAYNLAEAFGWSERTLRSRMKLAGVTLADLKRRRGGHIVG